MYAISFKYLLVISLKVCTVHYDQDSCHACETQRDFPHRYFRGYLTPLKSIWLLQSVRISPQNAETVCDYDKLKIHLHSCSHNRVSKPLLMRKEALINPYC